MFKITIFLIFLILPNFTKKMRVRKKSSRENMDTFEMMKNVLGLTGLVTAIVGFSKVARPFINSTTKYSKQAYSVAK